MILVASLVPSVSHLFAGAGHAQEVGSAIYVRSDNDHTVVVAPRLRVQAPIAEPTRATVVYAADVWTSASIDIMASASKLPVTEQRDELDLSIDHELEDVTLTAAYRYSTEPDYTSHGGSGGFSFDFADNNSTIALGLSGSSDVVGKAGDPMFARDAGTLGGRFSFTQVLGEGTVAQAMYELSRGSGYQASPYRFVALGGEGRCTVERPEVAAAPMAPTGQMPVMPVGVGMPAPLAPACVPEATPGERLRHAAALELRQALGDTWSLGAGYRFYFDDWSVKSHTVRAELTWLAAQSTLLSLRYRFYTQGAAEFYRAHYLMPQAYVTSDKELSPLSSHRVALELDREWPFAGDRKIASVLSLASIYYAYSDFPPLDSILAFEVNVAMVLRL